MKTFVLPVLGFALWAAALARLGSAGTQARATARPGAAGSSQPDSAPSLFERSVRPVLFHKCAPCHEPDGQMYDRLPFDNPLVVSSNAKGVSRRLKGADRETLERWLATAESRVDVPIVEAVRQWWRAWEMRDLRRLESLATEDFMEFTGSGPSRRVGRGPLLKIAEEIFPKLNLKKWEIREPLVHRYGEFAVCNYSFSEEGDFEGKPFRRSGSATDVLRNLQGG